MKMVTLAERDAMVEAFESLPIVLSHERLSAMRGNTGPLLWSKLQDHLNFTHDEWMGLKVEVERADVYAPGKSFGNPIRIKMGDITFKTLSTDSGEKFVMALIPNRTNPVTRVFACRSNSERLVSMIRLLAKSILHA